MNPHDRQTPDAKPRPYAQPRLTQYGAVEKLTQAGGTTSAEHGVSAMKLGA